MELERPGGRRFQSPSLDTFSATPPLSTGLGAGLSREHGLSGISPRLCPRWSAQQWSVSPDVGVPVQPRRPPYWTSAGFLQDVLTSQSSNCSFA